MAQSVFCLYYILQLPVDRGKGIVSLMFLIPSKVCKYRSNPKPKPPCGVVPNRLKSKYLQENRKQFSSPATLYETVKCTTV